MIQNMSIFVCPHCAEKVHIFGSDGVLRECNKHGVSFLGDIPLHENICKDADRGKPTMVAEPHSARAMAFLDIARKLDAKLRLGWQ